MIHPFKKPTPQKVARQQLEQARLEKLQAEAAAEYWKHQVAMLGERINRLETAGSPQ